MGPTTLFGTIYESYYTISANFYLYLRYFPQKVFNFNKINGFQTDPKYLFSPHFMLVYSHVLLDMKITVIIRSRGARASSTLMWVVPIQFQYLIIFSSKTMCLYLYIMYLFLEQYNYSQWRLQKFF